MSQQKQKKILTALLGGVAVVALAGLSYLLLSGPEEDPSLVDAGTGTGGVASKQGSEAETLDLTGDQPEEEESPRPKIGGKELPKGLKLPPTEGMSDLEKQIRAILASYRRLIQRSGDRRDPREAMGLYPANPEFRRLEGKYVADLARLGPQAVMVMVKVMPTVTGHEQRVLVKAIVDIGGPAAVEGFAAILKEAPFTVKQLALMFVPELEPEGIQQVLIEAFREAGVGQLRVEILRALAEYHEDPDVFAFLLEQLQDPDSLPQLVKIELIRSIEKLDNAEAADRLAELTRAETSLEVRRTALKAYVSLREHESIDLLEELLERPSGFSKLGGDDLFKLKATAVALLARLIDRPRVLSVLDRVAAQDPDPRIRDRASEAAKRLRDQKFQPIDGRSPEVPRPGGEETQPLQPGD